MTMHTIFFKENEGIFPDPSNGRSQSAIPMWSVVGSQPPRPPYNNRYLQSKPPSLELSAGINLKLAVPKQSDDQDLQVLANKDTTHFTVFPGGDCRSAHEINGAKMTANNSMDYYRQGELKLGLGQALIYGQYPYNAEQWYGIYSAYGAQIEGRQALSMGSDGGPIFVNAKQYNGIMRRRRSRAKAESKNQEIKLRKGKPYMHLSRHLHAVRRQRGSGGRFLSTKTSKMENHESSSADQSQVLEENFSSPAPSEVTSYLHHFEFDRSFLEVGATNYLKV